MRIQINKMSNERDHGRIIIMYRNISFIIKTFNEFVKMKSYNINFI